MQHTRRNNRGRKAPGKDRAGIEGVGVTGQNGGVWTVAEWVRGAKISKAGFYALPPELRPQSKKILRRRLIHEPPEVWLRRVGVDA